jgi:AraC-like DNA-binding protein
VPSDRSLVSETWNVRIYHVEVASYEAIEIQNMVYPYWVASFVQEGRVEVTDGNAVQTAVSGQLMLHAPGQPFGEKALTPGRHQWLLIEVKNEFDVDLFRVYPVGEVLTIAEPKDFSALFDRLLVGWKNQDTPFKEIQLNGLGLQLVHLLLENWHRSGRVPRRFHSKKQDERLEQVMSHLIASLDKKVTRQVLAERVHLNANYLDKIFEGKYLLKPMQMLREFRLKQVKRMLESSDNTLAEIAEQCGMNDAPYVSHQFQKRYGMTPGKYREQVRLAQHSYYL